MSPFSWIRRRVAESVVAGFNDGLTALAPADGEAPPDLDGLKLLVGRLVDVKALPPVEPEPEAKGRKARA